MAELALAAAAFIATHFVSSTPLRQRLIRKLGERAYRGLYSLVALATLLWMIRAFAQAPLELLWPGLKPLPAIVMPFALVLLVCGDRLNPTMVGAEKLLRNADPARGMIRVTRHPIMWGLMLWAASHVLARGDLKGVIFFGGLLFVAAAGTLLMDSRKKANPDWARFEAVTSHIPFVAIAQGRNRLDWREIGWTRPLIGLAAFAAFFLLHPWIFGARPY